jgi:hypothetical protein
LSQFPIGSCVRLNMWYAEDSRRIEANCSDKGCIGLLHAAEEPARFLIKRRQCGIVSPTRTAPLTDARLKKRIVRTVIHEVVADPRNRY